jgi:hypothetical protein
LPLTAPGTMSNQPLRLHNAAAREPSGETSTPNFASSLGGGRLVHPPVSLHPGPPHPPGTEWAHSSSPFTLVMHSVTATRCAWVDPDIQWMGSFMGPDITRAPRPRQTALRPSRRPHPLYHWSTSPQPRHAACTAPGLRSPANGHLGPHGHVPALALRPGPVRIHDC